MPTVEPSPTKLPFRVGMEARDLTAVVDSFAADAIVRSPFTARLAFKGRDQIGALVEVILEVFKDLRYTDEVRREDTAFLVGRARIGGQDIEMVDHLRLGADGTIQELTVFFRPLPAATVALRVIGAALVRRKSPIRSAVVSTLARPLAFMSRTGDGVGVRLVRSAL